jgi:unsaturated rhamnogalacturonyl hydrolase
MGYWFYRWDWGEGIAFEGLDAWSRATNRPQFSAFVSEVLDHWVRATVGTPSRFGPAICLLDRINGEFEKGYLGFARQIGDVLLSAKMTSGVVVLDGASSSIFVDSLCADPPFLLRLARMTGDERYAVRAHEIVLGHCRVLQNATTGLFGHFADITSGIAPGIAWGRGNGWAAAGLSNYLSECEPCGERNEVEARFKHLCDGLRRHQIPGSGWRNLIDREESYPESSSTALIAYALAKSIGTGVLSTRWRQLADEAWCAIEHRLDTSGHLTSVSYRPGVNTDPARYEHAPALGGAYPWSQGPYLLAAAQHLPG